VVYFAQRRKARKGCGFSVFILYAFERCAFAKAVWVNFTLRLMFSFVPFVVRCAVFISRRDAEAQRLYPFYACAACFEAALSQRAMGVSSRFALCALM